MRRSRHSYDIARSHWVGSADENHQGGRSIYTRWRCRCLGTHPGGPDRPYTGADDGDRESPGGRHRDRNRRGGTCGTYPVAASAANALLWEHVTSVLISYAAVGEQVKAGKLRALAVATPMRIDALADVPTVAESGYAGYEADLWDGVVVPAKTA